MKKRFFAVVFTAFIALVTMFGCTPHNAVAIEGDDGEEEGVIFDSVDDPGPVEIIEDPPEIVEPAPDPDPEPDPEPVIDPNVELSKKYFNVTEEWAKDYGGLFIKQDGQYYSVTDSVPEQNYYNTGIGYLYGTDGTGGIGLWADDTHESYVVHDLDVIFPVYREGDEAIFFEQEDMSESLTFVPITQKGYTVSAYSFNKAGYTLCILKDWEDLLNTGRLWTTNYELMDSNGDSVEDIRSLEREKEYTIKYDEGEISLLANCRYYEKTGEAITITGINQEESLLYDLTVLPSGDYFIIEQNSFITIE